MLLAVLILFFVSSVQLSSVWGPIGTHGQELSPAPLIVCNKGCVFASIQQAIDAASSGSTVHVKPGNYQENLTINKKNLTLEGLDRDQVILEPEDPLMPLITIDDAQVVIRSLTLQAGSGGKQKNDDVGVRAIYIKGTSQAKIMGNRIVGPRNGTSIEVLGPAQARIEENQIQSASFGIIVGQGTDSLPQAQGVGQALILNNDIFGHSANGILGSNLLAQGNLIHDNMIGLSVQQTTLWKNKIFANNKTGVEVTGHSVELVSNEVSQNEDGIMLFMGYLIASENKVHNNRRWGFALWNKDCGYEYGVRDPSEVLVDGVSNELTGNMNGSLCPASKPWPRNF